MDFKEFVNKLEQDLKDALSEIQGSSYTGISITPADSHSISLERLKNLEEAVE